MEEWIWTSKGYIVVQVEVEGPPPVRYSLTMRDPTRLAQDVEAEVADSHMFSESNVIVLPSIDRQSIEAAVRGLSDRGFRGLVPDED